MIILSLTNRAKSITSVTIVANLITKFTDVMLHGCPPKSVAAAQTAPVQPFI